MYVIGVTFPEVKVVERCDGGDVRVLLEPRRGGGLRLVLSAVHDTRFIPCSGSSMYSDGLRVVRGGLQ